MKIDQYSLKYTATGPPQKTGTKKNIFGEMDKVDRVEATEKGRRSWRWSIWVLGIRLQIQSFFPARYDRLPEGNFFQTHEQ